MAVQQKKSIFPFNTGPYCIQYHTVRALSTTVQAEELVSVVSC